ncbi:homocitrate synthase NifV [Ruminiclostridium sufflavum DSM 19573]|uniref:Homocitrate synthase NifV n=1 Tax=Ruminiclostridium sufflavum DSM 19573 TaxID=1121337 RepID=A0A318XFX5_9FIRM|nr:homocitrate synthase [Ruminiclostridium sufflavum]PYG84827.1 homocitrate synthase NifV [Ruminiclostridium sufflavum DSM 19573]
MKEKKYLTDTTLRDGEQSPGFAFNIAEKARLAQLMDEAGIYQIEAGVPAMGKHEKDAICKIVSNKKNARISTWNRIIKEDILHSFDCCPDIIHISAPVSYVHIYSKLKKNKVWLQKSLQDCVSLALDKGYTVTVGMEDASRADITFIISIANIMKDMGVAGIRFADTVGVLTPFRTYQAISEIINNTGISVGIHAHNDLGMAVANSLEAAKAGADFIDTTLFGIGERAGNCDLNHFISVADKLFDISPGYAAAMSLKEYAGEILFK